MLGPPPDLPVARPGRSTPTASLGKIQTTLLGKITLVSTRTTRRTSSPIYAPGSHPHVAQHTTGRRSVIDRRIAGAIPGIPRASGVPPRLEEAFGWSKTTGGLRKTQHRRIARVGWTFTLTAAAWYLVRPPPSCWGGLTRAGLRQNAPERAPTAAQYLSQVPATASGPEDGGGIAALKVENRVDISEQTRQKPLQPMRLLAVAESGSWARGAVPFIIAETRDVSAASLGLILVILPGPSTCL